MSSILLPVYCYARVSTNEQINGFGLERQYQTLHDFLTYCNDVVGHDSLPQLDLEKVSNLSDKGLSAYRHLNWDRGELGKFYDSVVNGSIGSCYLVCENLDRLSRRNPYDAINRITCLIQRGVYIFEVETQQVYCRERPQTILGLQMSLSRAFSESKRKSIMTQKSQKNRINRYQESGVLFTTSKRIIPRWLDIDLENQKYIPNETAKNIVSAFELYSAGYGNKQICQKLNNAGQLDVNRIWNPVSLNRVLRDRRVIGEKHFGHQSREKGKGEIIENIWPVIVERDLFNDVQNRINNHPASHIDRTTRSQKNLFNGITKCGICGSAASVLVNGAGVLYIVCVARRHNVDNICTDGKYMLYSPIEKSLVDFINTIDWADIYHPEQNTRSKLDKLYATLNATDSKIMELKKELDESDDDIVIHVVRAIKKQQAVLNDIQGKIKVLEDTNNKKLELKPTSSIFEQKNIELRQSVNVAYRNVIKTISLIRIDSTYVFAAIKYYTSKCHFLMINVKDSKVESFFTYEADKPATFEFTGDSADSLREITEHAINEYIKTHK
ncbi:recombinase family protein [Edwardsiella tarda]|uniref:recombinase family protein n=1 Tax=Edwardsiella tarda TaxID=636 RepID=UPI00351C049C